MVNIFEKASKNKLRFEYKGLISAEDLWDLPVEELDSIYKDLNAKRKQAEDDSLLDNNTDKTENTHIEIIKHIVSYKLQLKKARLLAAEKKVKKEKIMAILASKEDSALEKKSTASLKKMLEDL